MFGYKNTGTKGHFLMTKPDGHTVQGETLQCVHCGMHWVMQKGSGKKRGFCLKCMGPLCGKKQCFRCIPYEKQVEILEGKKHASSFTHISAGGIYIAK